MLTICHLIFTFAKITQTYNVKKKKFGLSVPDRNIKKYANKR